MLYKTPRRVHGLGNMDSDIEHKCAHSVVTGPIKILNIIIGDI